jgi:hypothetical protein
MGAHNWNNFPKIKPGDKVKITWTEDAFYGIQETGEAFVAGGVTMVRFERKDVPADSLREIDGIERTEIIK